MPHPINGELVPIGGGDNIPLLRPVLTFGRRESCDVCLKFPNISGQHCEMSFKDGVWYIRDLGSTNGTKVNGERIQSTKPLRPGDEVCIGKRPYKIQYKMPAGVHVAIEEEDITSQSLLEKAGLAKPKQPPKPRPGNPFVGGGGGGEGWGSSDE
jgi:adenylate cyclase